MGVTFFGMTYQKDLGFCAGLHYDVAGGWHGSERQRQRPANPNPSPTPQVVAYRKIEENIEESYRSMCELSGGTVVAVGDQSLPRQLRDFTAMVRERYIVEFPRPANGTGGTHGFLVQVEKSNDLYGRRHIPAAGPLGEGRSDDDPGRAFGDAAGGSEAKGENSVMRRAMWKGLAAYVLLAGSGMLCAQNALALPQTVAAPDAGVTTLQVCTTCCRCQRWC